MWLRSDRTTTSPITFTPPSFDDGETPAGVRCPLCAWRPSGSELWRCGGADGPDPFEGCGTVWHTFDTHGRCPGCGHQWQWTVCPRCAEWSPHDDWYESG